MIFHSKIKLNVIIKRKRRAIKISKVDILYILNGVGINKIISVSKIKKITETKKNRNENIDRELLVSNPDSKVEDFSFNNYIKFNLRMKIGPEKRNKK